MNQWLFLLAAGLATMRIVALAKEAIPWPLRPWTKSVLAMLIGVVACVPLNVGFHQTLILGIGAAGVAALCHEIQDYLSVKGDETKQSVIIRSAGGRRTRL